jgi:hypothetical protein
MSPQRWPLLTTPAVGSYITGQCIALDGGQRWAAAGAD